MSTESKEPKNTGSRVLLVLLCNEPMRKRCQALATTLNAPAGKSSRAITTRLKCLTYVEQASGYGAFSISEATDRIATNASMVLCLLRVTTVHPDACNQLYKMLTAKSSSHLSAERILMMQCCGSAYSLRTANDKISGSCQDTNPAIVDDFLRAWLAGCLGCEQLELSHITVDNSAAGKVLHHKIFSRRYTMQVEFTTTAALRRRSLVQLTEGMEAENGRCSPPAVVKRRMSVSDSVKFDARYPGLSVCSELKEPLFHLDMPVNCTGAAVRESGVPVTLVICPSNSCTKEASLCLNNLSSRGHRAVTIETFAAKHLRRFSTPCLIPDACGGRLSRLLSRLTPSVAASAVLLLICAKPCSRLLTDFLNFASSPSTACLPRACFVVLINPVSEAQSQELQRQASSSTPAQCQLDVVCCPSGMRGSRVIDSLVPELTMLMRQMEVPKCRQSIVEGQKPDASEAA